MGVNLALVLLSVMGFSEPQFRTDAQAVFGGCQKGMSQGVSDRSYQCPDNLAFSIALVPALSKDPEIELEFLRTGIRSFLPADFQEQRFTIVLAGKPRKALLYLAPSTSADLAFSEGTIIPSKEGWWCLICVASHNGRTQREWCVKAFDYFARNGVPDGVKLSLPSEPSEAAILKHKLTVPAGCKLAAGDNNAGRLQCDTSMLSWTVLVEGETSLSRWLDETVATLGKTLGQGAWNDDRIPCRVEGLATRCARLHRDIPGRGSVEALVGAVYLDGHPLMVTCAFGNAPYRNPPPVCNGTISFP